MKSLITYIPPYNYYKPTTTSIDYAKGIIYLILKELNIKSKPEIIFIKNKKEFNQIRGIKNNIMIMINELKFYS